MTNITETISAIAASIFLLLTPTFVIQACMIALLCLTLWMEYFSKRFNKGYFEYITLPVSGIMASVMFYYAPIIQTNIALTIAFATYAVFVSVVLKHILKKVRGSKPQEVESESKVEEQMMTDQGTQTTSGEGSKHG